MYMDVHGTRDSARNHDIRGGNDKKTLAIVRIVIGVLAFVAPRFASRIFLFPEGDDNVTARTMGRLFGVRDTAIGVIALASDSDPKASARLHRIVACVDAGDAVAAALMLRTGKANGASIALLAAAVPAAISGVMIAKAEDQRAAAQD